MYFLNENPVKFIGNPQFGLLQSLLSIVVVFGVFISIETTNLKPIQADILFKLAEPFSAASQWDIVSVIYDRAIEKNSNEDYYFLFRGKVFLELAKLAQSPADQTSQVLRSEESLLQAQSLNPLNPDHSANLARVFSWWASVVQTEDRKADLVDKASSYYQKAVILKPKSPLLWGEWSTLYSDVVHQQERSKILLDKALSLDDEYDVIQAMAGNYYLKLARQVTDFNEREAAYTEAINYFENAVNLSKGAARIKYLVDLSKVYIDQAEIIDQESVEFVYDPDKLEAALRILLQADFENETSYESVSIKAQIAKIYHELNDNHNALRYIDLAIAESSDIQKAYLDQIKSEILKSP